MRLTNMQKVVLGEIVFGHYVVRLDNRDRRTLRALVMKGLLQWDGHLHHATAAGMNVAKKW